MKNMFKLLTVLMLGIALTACQKQSTEKTASEPGDKEIMFEAPQQTYEGTVLSTTNAANYTYVELEKGGEKIWAAGPQTEVKAGDKVTLTGVSKMHNFQSKSLNRTFETILFSAQISVAGKEGAAPAAADNMTGGGAGSPHGGAGAPAKTAGPAAGEIKKAKGGYTVSEVFAKKGELAEKSIEIRGKIVKANPAILDTNWYHIQDGSGEAGTNDLVITSRETASPGDIVVAKGTLRLDKDFGSGYVYDVIVEDATFTKE
ncbi:MAG: hypothetical protein OEV42_17820 [Deltaproteobacteria bacterium]|nr:hypothetical protein [Deltaproteobacteria bacterium]